MRLDVGEEGTCPLQDESGALLCDEMPALGHQFHRHHMCVGLVASQQLGGDEDVARAIEHQRRDTQRERTIAPKGDGKELAQQEGAIERDRGVCALWLLQACCVASPILIGEGLLIHETASQNDRTDKIRSLSEQPVSESRKRDHPLIPEAPERTEYRPIEPLPGMRDIEGEKALHAFGVT